MTAGGEKFHDDGEERRGAKATMLD